MHVRFCDQIEINCLNVILGGVDAIEFLVAGSEEVCEDRYPNLLLAAFYR